jgi:hypothetical protein
MRKLTPGPEMLAVESFVADEGADDRAGTVRGHSFITVYDKACGEGPTPYCDGTDYHVYSCGVSCIEECDLTGNQPTCSG